MTDKPLCRKLKTACWIVADTDWHGYKAVYFQGKSERLHRLIYSKFVGDLVPGMTIDHLCRNRACFNPEHLEQVTIAENVLRGESLIAQGARKTHCKRGHALEGENVNMRGNRRRCRTCIKIRSKRRSEPSYAI
ncbi:MAG: HNH endonuclease [Patescibacteria group bacterium]|nr:HNH endonuclease [Patescibacteria group bacterium]